MEDQTCTKCGATVDPLEVFPGTVCIGCHAASPEGRRMPTANELTAMWGGRTLPKEARNA